MKVALLCVPLVLMVARVCSLSVASTPAAARPDNFGFRYAVHADTQSTTCHYPGGCKSRWYQTQYYQNLDNVIKPKIREDTNVRNYHENIYYTERGRQRGRTLIQYRYAPSKPRDCPTHRVASLPILGVHRSYRYIGKGYVEGKLCDKWQKVFAPGAAATWFVHFNKHVSPHRYEPALFLYERYEGRKLAFRLKTHYRGYSPNVADSMFDLPEQCY